LQPIFNSAISAFSAFFEVSFVSITILKWFVMISLDECWQRGYRSLLWRTRPANLQAEIEALAANVNREMMRGLDCPAACESVYRAQRNLIIERLLFERFGRIEAESSRSSQRRREQLAELLERSIPQTPSGDDPDFHCDAALGGLARWLRAIGYDARFWPGIADADLVRKMIGSSAILLTTDSRLMQHGAIAHGAIAALLVPITLDKLGQAEFTVAQLELPVRATRCMGCGGVLERVEKESVRERIPPRTYPWLDEYFQCRRCGRLFWEGTHWQRIRERLKRLEAPNRGR
jgi:uncharacterized protein with PIN domain